MANTKKIKVKNKTEKNQEEAIGLDIQLSKSEAFIEKNWKPILTALVAVIIIVAGWFIWRNHMNNVEKKAQAVIRTSQTLFGQQQWENALKGDGANNIGFLRIIDEYSGTKTANLAKLYAAICYANTEKYDEAIQYFEDFSPKDDQMISPAAVAALGNCYVEKGNTAKGAETLIKAAKKADNDAVSPVFLVQAANLYKSLNQNDKALELYKEVKTKYFRSPLSTQMDKYIEELSK